MKSERTRVYTVSLVSTLAWINMTLKQNKRTRTLGFYFPTAIGYAFDFMNINMIARAEHNSSLTHNGTYALMFSLN